MPYLNLNLNMFYLDIHFRPWCHDFAVWREGEGSRCVCRHKRLF